MTKGLLEETSELLHRDEAEIPEWHKIILAEREEKYKNGEEEMLEWEEVKKQL